LTGFATSPPADDGPDFITQGPPLRPRRRAFSSAYLTGAAEPLVESRHASGVIGRPSTSFMDARDDAGALEGVAVRLALCMEPAGHA